MIPPITFPQELTVLAALIDSPQLLPEASQILTLEDFSDPITRTCWEWITGLMLKGRPVSMFSLHQTWGHHEMFSLVKSSLSDVPSVFGEGLHYVSLLKDRAKLRRAFITLEHALKIASAADTFDAARPSLEAALMASFEDAASSEDCTLGEAVRGVLAQMKNPATAQRSFPTGFRELDSMFTRAGAPVETNMIVVAGKSGEGKSSLALNILLEASARGVPAKVYSMEMDRNDIAIRSGLNFARGNTFDAAMAKAESLPVWISDRSDRTVESIRSDIRLSAMRHGVKIVIVDYLQLIGHAPTKENRERQVAHMSRMLKLAAMESKVLVYALSQLNDDGKLRESRAIEQDSDAVVYVAAKEGHHYLWLTKNRRGPKHGSLNDMVSGSNLEKQGIKMDFDSQNYKFHPYHQ